MITLNLSMPESVASEYFQAADELNQRFGDTKPRIEAKALMTFVLCRYDAKEIAGQFDLALRVVSGAAEPPMHPVLK